MLSQTNGWREGRRKRVIGSGYGFRLWVPAKADAESRNDVDLVYEELNCGISGS